MNLVTSTSYACCSFFYKSWQHSLVFLLFVYLLLYLLQFSNNKLHSTKTAFITRATEWNLVRGSKLSTLADLFIKHCFHPLRPPPPQWNKTHRYQSGVPAQHPSLLCHNHKEGWLKLITVLLYETYYHDALDQTYSSPSLDIVLSLSLRFSYHFTMVFIGIMPFDTIKLF